MSVTKDRHKFIGGSDVAAILGINPYKTSYDVWEEKKHGIKTFEGNAATEWGTKLEPLIVNHCEQLNNRIIAFRNVRFISNIEFIGCHPDGIMKNIPKEQVNLESAEISESDILIEAKTVSSKAYKNWQNEIPLEYYCQIQHNLFCCGLLQAKFIYFVLDDRYYDEITVNRDDDFIKKQNEYLTSWWNRYIIGDETPIKVVADFEKSSPEIEIAEANEEILGIFEQLNEYKEKIKELTERKEALENDLKTFIGDKTDLYYGINLLATWRPQTRITVDTKRLKEEQPLIFSQYAKENKSRTFLIKQK